MVGIRSWLARRPDRLVPAPVVSAYDEWGAPGSRGWEMWAAVWGRDLEVLAAEFYPWEHQTTPEALRVSGGGKYAAAQPAIKWPVPAIASPVTCFGYIWRNKKRALGDALEWKHDELWTEWTCCQRNGNRKE